MFLSRRLGMSAYVSADEAGAVKTEDVHNKRVVKYVVHVEHFWIYIHKGARYEKNRREIPLAAHCAEHNVHG